MRTLKFDLHTHTNNSPKCGFLTPEKLVKKAISRRLDGIAVTDHDTIKGALEARKFETENFKVIVGCELMTTKGEIIGLFLNEEIKSRDPFEAISEIHKQGGIVVVPHPFDKFRSSRFNNVDSIVHLLDGIEVLNSRCLKNESNEDARKYALKKQKDYNLVMLAGSDAHFSNEVGHAYNEINVDNEAYDKDPMQALKVSILAGNVDVSGRKSSLINHAGTKLLKWKKRYVSY
ncbi:PHP domain-containing protein [Methanolobus bombayensis]|uniref:PHP domain-containing protein n=1 Tax=Methanolobus bombayensis TaxID=38023 RepID=UPI001FD75620|nr:PHP domain-containing protein [Methanolobus bombayensis]MBP1908202.1 putative metal-dependent phosphoesterase TrpH [Methanolobus bombayensis]